MITARELAIKLNQFTKAENEDLARVVTELNSTGNDYLTSAQERTLHHVAEYYATECLIYLRDHQRDHDGTMASAGMLMIQNAVHAAEAWQQVGMPAGHIVNHGLHAVARAAIAAYTWSSITLGVVETTQRLTTIPKHPSVIRSTRPRHLNAVPHPNTEVRVPVYVLDVFDDEHDDPAVDVVQDVDRDDPARSSS